MSTFNKLKIKELKNDSAVTIDQIMKKKYKLYKICDGGQTKYVLNLA